MGKEKIIPIFAIIVLLIGIFSTLYVHASRSSNVVEEGQIVIAGETYSFEEIFSSTEQKTIETTEGEKTGVALDNLIINNFKTLCYSCHDYIIEGEDGYKKTVDWYMMQKGILAENGQVFFTDSARAFWIRDVIKIEVK